MSSDDDDKELPRLAIRINLFAPINVVLIVQSLLNNKKISHTQMEGFDSLVKDMSLAEWGRKEIELAQVEMPGTLFLSL